MAKELTKEHIEKRIQIMAQINHPEEYYKSSAASQGFDVETMTHGDIVLLKASMLVVEADAIILFATSAPVMEFDNELDDYATKIPQE